MACERGASEAVGEALLFRGAHAPKVATAPDATNCRRFIARTFLNKKLKIAGEFLDYARERMPIHARGIVYPWKSLKRAAFPMSLFLLC
jgi:hypothetical protein